MPEAVQAGDGEPLCCGSVDDASLVVMEPWVGGSLRILRPDFVDEHMRGWATIADQLDTRLRTRAALRP